MKYSNIYKITKFFQSISQFRMFALRILFFYLFRKRDDWSKGPNLHILVSFYYIIQLIWIHLHKYLIPKVISLHRIIYFILFRIDIASVYSYTGWDRFYWIYWISVENNHLLFRVVKNHNKKDTCLLLQT
jgi:hypothetical protein